MYRHLNLSFFLALALACVLAVFADFDGGLGLDEETAVAPSAIAEEPAAVPVAPIEEGLADPLEDRTTPDSPLESAPAPADVS